MTETENRKRVAIQGYHGCFHEQAARIFYEKYDGRTPDIVECPTFDDLYRSMDTGHADAAVMAIENTHQYKGVYHVLGGVISPMDGVGPSDLQIQSLVDRVAEGGVSEVILALSPTMEGDTTNFYIYRKLEHSGVVMTVIARGVAQNDELQYTDEVTLGRSIVNRVAFNGRI